MTLSWLCSYNSSTLVTPASLTPRHPKSLSPLVVVARTYAKKTFRKGLNKAKKAAGNMPPKKSKEVEEDGPLLLGRFGTSLKIGIVGLPNVG